MYNLLSLCKDVYSEAKAVEFLQERGILHSSRKCSNGHEMRLHASGDDFRWRCNRIGCRMQRQIKSDTWLEGAKLPYQKICLFIYSWSHELTSVAFTKRELGFGSIETVVDWNHYMREICMAKLLKNPICIGGSGLHVEIDESLFVKRKYNVGREINQQWVFGGICRETGECFLYAVPDRSAESLLAIIAENIKAESTIISDEWRGYRGIAEIQDRSYKHITVNHSKHFIDPVSGACTNKVESMWGKAKMRNKKHWGTHRTMIDSYLFEFMWRARFAGEDPFSSILRDISELNPLA